VDLKNKCNKTENDITEIKKLKLKICDKKPQNLKTSFQEKNIYGLILFFLLNFFKVLKKNHLLLFINY
jgi:hypothetical protein